MDKIDFVNGSQPALNATNLNQMQSNIETAINNIQLPLSTIFPIGKIELFFDDSDYSNYLGFTWELVAEGEMLAGVGTGTDSNSVTKTFTAGDNAGEYEHTLTEAQLPNITGSFKLGAYVATTVSGASAFTTVSGKFTRSTTSESDRAIVSGTNSGNLAYNTINMSFGSGTAHNITNPTYGVYIWKRIA